jgi:hypothetical protein
MVGSSMGIIGGIEPTQLLNLTEAELVPYVESVIMDAQGGPFVLANSDSCPPGDTIYRKDQENEGKTTHCPGHGGPPSP